MSTSFCYGLLFAGRKEVQGIGLRWFDMWDESSPGDPMSLGLVLIMLFIDGCIYTLVGYIITRYTNSGKPATECFIVPGRTCMESDQRNGARESF